MPVPIYKQAEKCFADSKSFERLSSALPSGLEGAFRLKPLEECIGIYHNTQTIEELVLITDMGLHIADKQDPAIFVSYSDINEISWLDPERMTESSRRV